jgi:hypothetical protein
MGGNQITNATMSVLGTQYEVATKQYVDNLVAGANPVLELSAESGSAMGNFGAALAYCVGLTGDTADRPWRLPTMEELLVAASSHTDGSSSTNYIWTTTMYNASTARSTDFSGGGVTNGGWIRINLGDGRWHYRLYDDATNYARCVR